MTKLYRFIIQTKVSCHHELKVRKCLEAENKNEKKYIKKNEHLCEIPWLCMCASILTRTSVIIHTKLWCFFFSKRKSSWG